MHSCDAFGVPCGQHFINKLPVSEENTPVMLLLICVTARHRTPDSLSNRTAWMRKRIECKPSPRELRCLALSLPHYCPPGKQDALSSLFSLHQESACFHLFHDHPQSR